MRKLCYFVALTVDGKISGPNGETEHFPLEGDHIAAQIELLPETLPVHVRQALGLPAPQGRFDTVLMGRKTYAPALALGIADPYAPLATIVFSRELPARTEGKLRITAEDPAAVVRELRARPGRDIWLCGGGSLAGRLADEIDELVIKVNPVWSGAGVGLFDGPFRPTRLVLRDQRRFESGVVWLTYDRAR